MKLIELQEKRGALIKDCRELLDKAKSETRALTPEEHSRFEGMENDISALDSTLQAEMRHLARESQKPVNLSAGEERDIKRFDIGKIVRHLDAVHRGRPSQLDGLELEVSQQGQQDAAAAGVEVRGIMLPDFIARRSGIGTEYRDLSVTGGTSQQFGGTLVATEKRGLLDDFYNSSIMISSGAMVLSGLAGNVDLPRYNKAGDPAKKTENAAADELSPTFASLSLSPKRLPAVIDISDQLLRQTSALETFLRAALSTQLTAVQEKAFWHGVGTNEANGVAGTSGIGSVIGSTNGAAPDWADIVDLETAVAIDNALVGNLGYATNAKVRGKLKKTVVASGTSADMVWDRLTPNTPLNGYSCGVTNAISSTLTKGSANSVCSAIFFGNFADYVVGYWGGIDLEIVTDKTLRSQGQRALVANLYYDGGLLRAESFAAMLDALTA